jgi:hypothetical protein
MLAAIAAVVLAIALLSDLINSNFGAPDLINWNTLVLIALFLLALHFAGVGSWGDGGRRWYRRG